MTRRRHAQASHRENNFDALRFFAAFGVVFSHAFFFTQGSNRFEPLSVASAGQTSIGEVCVFVFFIISGYLITQSFERSSSVWRYVRARLLRILPGLFVALLFTAFVIGPLFTVTSLRQYFLSPAVYEYVLRNVTLVHYMGSLPGLFLDNPVAGVVNSPLWTLRFEAACYVMVLLLGVTRLLDRRVVLVLFLVDLALVPLVLNSFIAARLGASQPIVLLENFIKLSTLFLGGSLLYLWQPPQKWPLAALALGVSAAGLWTGQFIPIFAVCGSYLVIYLAIARDIRLPKMAKWGDVSYGVYIYAAVIQQVLVLTLGSALGWFWNFLIAAPIALVLAGLSWHFVESVALSFKGDGQRARRREPAGVPDEQRAVRSAPTAPG